MTKGLLIKNKLTSLIFILCVSSFSFGSSSDSFAGRKIKETNYFASLRASETNVRAGPGIKYPLKFIFKLRSIPVRVISEYDNWSEIEDYEGNSGWVTQSLLTKKRTLMVYTTKPFINMHAQNSKKSNIIYRLENNVIGSYIKCLDKWCVLKIENKKGWVEKVDLWVILLKIIRFGSSTLYFLF